MIKMPLNEIVAKIKEKSQLSEEDINKKIEDKLTQLSGLISKEGAAHIIANELGVNLFEQGVSGKLQIKNILEGMRDVETVGRVQQAFNVNEFQRKDGTPGKVGSLILGDETGTIRLTMWGDQADNVNKVSKGDIIKIQGGYVRENRGNKEIHLNDRSKFIVNPEGETVAEMKIERKGIKDLTDQDSDTEIAGTVVQVFDLRFFEVCPECKRRVREKEGSFVCSTHNAVNPIYSYVLTIFLDDGTDNIRTIFFGNQVENLLKKSREEVMSFREDVEKFSIVKNELLGEQIKVNGRVNKNEMFNRLEFVGNKVEQINPEAEIKNLQQNS